MNRQVPQLNIGGVVCCQIKVCALETPFPPHTPLRCRSGVCVFYLLRNERLAKVGRGKNEQTSAIVKHRCCQLDKGLSLETPFPPHTSLRCRSGVFNLLRNERLAKVGRGKNKDILSQVQVRWILCVDVSWSIISQHYKRVYGMTQLEKVLSWMRHIITFPRIQGKRDLTDGWRPP